VEVIGPLDVGPIAHGGQCVARSDGRVIFVRHALLDPPRTGAGTPVMRAAVARSPRAVAYVACDPAAFARDLRAALDAGWRLDRLRAFDCFPMTQHVETVALLVPG
jgi:tRNA/tmRNA/rRNA uracil-C5-methylase (TrmA/RlmC/RlmD family)